MSLGVQVIFDHFPELNEKQKVQFQALDAVYKDWNEKINVVSRKDIDELYMRHVLHSLALAKHTQFADQTKVLDIGTGGGFPGIPLAILYPNCTFLLVDSIGKKIKVVNEVAQAISLTNIEARHMRAEDVKGKFDFIVSRAVARTKMLLDWSNRLIQSNDHATQANGYLLLKGGDLDEELKELKRSYSQTDISEYFSDPFFETKKIVYIPM